MEARMKYFANDSARRTLPQRRTVTEGKSIHIERPHRVTKEQITVARIAVRKANDEARERRLQGGLNRT